MTPKTGDRVAWAWYLYHYPGDKHLLDPVSLKSGGPEASHPEVQGLVIDIHDTDYWQGTNVFRGRRASPSAVEAHVRVCREQGLFTDAVLVQFDTGRVALAIESELVSVGKDGVPAKRRKAPERKPRPATQTKTKTKAKPLAAPAAPEDALHKDAPRVGEWEAIEV